MIQTITFPGCWVNINTDVGYLETVFHDGTRLTSIPMPDKDGDTAQGYGYGDDWRRLWREHDLLHHWVAVQFGFEYSPTIWAECHPEHPDAIPLWARQQEEEFVADIHRWLNLDIWSPALDVLYTLHTNIEELRISAKRLLSLEETSCFLQAQLV